MIANDVNQSTAIGKTFLTACPAMGLCTATCPLEVTVQGGRITHVSDHPDYRACIKGHVQHMTVNDPARLKYPMVRVGQRGEAKFERITWDTAIDLYAGKIKEIGDKYGREAVLFYAARGIGGLARLAAKERFPNVLGGMVTCWGSLCIANKTAAAQTMFGTSATESDLDTIKDSSLAIFWGYGFADSNRRGDFAGEAMQITAEAKSRGTRIVVIDPFFSRTAAAADQWIPIMPGTDGAMVLAMANVIIDRGLVDREFVSKFVLGFDEFKQHVQPYTPEWAAGITGVPTETIIALAMEYATKQPAALFAGDGPSRAGHDPSQWVRACGALAALVGSMGKPGTNATSGTAYNKGITAGSLLAADKRKVGVKVNECQIADAILTGRALQPDGKTVAETPIRMLIGHGSSVVNQAGNSNKIVQALQQLDYIIAADHFVTPFVRYADLVLPATTVFEGNDAAFYGTAGHAIVYSEQAIEPMYECRSDLAIWAAVADKLVLGDEYHSNWKDVDWMRETLRVSAATNPDLVDVPLERLQKEHIVFVGPRPFIPFQDQVKGLKPFPTRSGKIELYSRELESRGLPPMPTYLDDFENLRHPLAQKYPLAITTPHMIGWLHSRTNNPLLKERFPVEVFIHPADATERGIQDGDAVVVFNDRGATRRMARVTEKVRQSVLAMAQGPWFDPGSDGVDHGGSVNVLTTDTIDRIGGAGTYNNTLVDVKKA